MMRVTFFILLLLLGCSEKQSAQDGKPFTKGVNKGIIDVRLEEASGLVESIANPGYLWSLNDGGNPAEVFLIDTLAKIKLVCKLNVKNRDWEDIALGAGPIKGKKYIYVADIGDNLGVHDYKYIYRFEEPPLTNVAEQTISVFDTLVIKLPGKNRDTETIMIDPTNNDFYIVSKREKHVHVYLQHFPYPDTLRPEEVLKIPFTRIVAGSISHDSQEVLLKDYENIYYWKRSGEKTLIELLAKDPIELPYKPEEQGESICWNNNASGYYTLSESHEGKIAQLKFYKRLK
ncbi:MAG TPA: hypothetical protein VGQ59_10480 [Cyclobacteriaceae bacterium]|nr:hypothetical protein [Cyclobacteriaceae bacterium]